MMLTTLTCNQMMLTTLKTVLTKGSIKLSKAQVAVQKSAAHALKASKSPPRAQSPIPTGSSDDDPERPEYIWPSSKGIFRKNKHWNGNKSNAPALLAPEPQKALPAPDLKAPPAPEPRQPTPVSSDREDQDELTEDQKRLARYGKKKAAASQRAPAGNPTKEAQASHPMQTRRQEASRAGSLRGVVGSGSTGYVCDELSPSPKPGS
jgi:hypothetical protein